MDMETEYGTPKVFVGQILRDYVPKITSYERMDDDEFEYVTKKCRGKIFIINNYNFGNRLPARDFSNLDMHFLIEAFKYVGFKDEDFENFSNLTTNQMYEVSTKAARTSYADAGCLVLIVMSHGDEKNLYGVDCQTITYEQLLQPIRKASTGSLQGKPKLFLIQACSLTYDPSPNTLTLHYPLPMHQSGAQPSTLLSAAAQPSIPAAAAWPSTMHRPAGARPSAMLSADDERLAHDAAEFGPSKPYSTASQSDVVIAYSTLPGTVHGSKFMQAFCQVMKRDGRRLEVTVMLARTSRIMSYMPNMSVPNKSIPTPCVISQLKGGFFFS